MEVTKAIKIGTTLAALSYPYGGNWGYLKDTDVNYDPFVQTMDSEDSKKIVKAYPVNNGVLFLVNKKYLDKLSKDMASTEDHQLFQQNRASVKDVEIKKFKQFLGHVFKQDESVVTEGTYSKEVSFVIYANTDAQTTQIMGERYRTFVLNLDSVIGYIRALEGKMGVEFLMRTENEFKKLSEIGDNLEEIYKGMVITDALNGVFITLRWEI